jgi:hypothetical protein
MEDTLSYRVFCARTRSGCANVRSYIIAASPPRLRPFPLLLFSSKAESFSNISTPLVSSFQVHFDNSRWRTTPTVRRTGPSAMSSTMVCDDCSRICVDDDEESIVYKYDNWSLESLKLSAQKGCPCCTFLLRHFRCKLEALGQEYDERWAASLWLEWTKTEGANRGVMAKLKIHPPYKGDPLYDDAKRRMRYTTETYLVLDVFAMRGTPLPLQSKQHMDANPGRRTKTGLEMVVREL